LKKEGKRETIFEVLGAYLRRCESASKKQRKREESFPFFIKEEKEEE
jgi:hypothetical protein